MSDTEVSRRGFMAAAGTATAAATTGAAAAQESPTPTEGDGGDGGGSGNEVPAFGSYLSDARLYEENQVEDLRGEDEVLVDVGAGEEGLSFGPPTVWIDPGTTITWEWTGDGGGHNVNTHEGPAELDSGSPTAEAGVTYEYEFTEEDAGITYYRCIPHETLGMKGAVAVGDDVETTTVGGEGGAGGPSVTIPDEALAMTVATFLAMVTTLVLGYAFMKFGGDYEPS